MILADQYVRRAINHRNYANAETLSDMETFRNGLENAIKRLRAEIKAAQPSEPPQYEPFVRIDGTTFIDDLLAERAAPPSKPLRTLTDEEIDGLALVGDMGHVNYGKDTQSHWRAFARAIERAIRSKSDAS
jgi:lysozyme family protein